MPENLITDGDFRFLRGANSYSDVIGLPPESYFFTLNMLNRGGVLQTRPGFDWSYTLPDGNLQGFVIFYPQLGLPQHIACVDGTLYASDYPFKKFVAIGGAKMDPNAKRVYMTLTCKSVQRNDDGSLTFITPKSILMLQDGVSPPSYYDGHTVQRVTGKWPTPQGSIMAWVNGRLWVARRNIAFAGDIADPTCFYEQQFNTLGGVSYFTLPEEITGFASTPGMQVPELLCFTNNTTSTFRADILNRDLWSQTEQFQRLIMPGLGCVAPWSINAQAGQLWWYSQYGYTMLDTAMATMQTTKVRYSDNEMMRSKSHLSSDLTGICSASFSNFLMLSVPHESSYNRHTWVLDPSVFDMLQEDAPAAWASVWNGVSPVQWGKVIIKGTSSLFCASKDRDGKNRVYKAFRPQSLDNGCSFPWRVESRGYTANTPAPKRLRFLNYRLSELSGQTDLKFSWAGASRGPWKTFATAHFSAQRGSIDSNKVIEATDTVFAMKKQERVARTEDIQFKKTDDFSSAGVEGPIYSIEVTDEKVDSAFQFCIEGSGPCAIRSIQPVFEPVVSPSTGQVAKPEGEDHFVRFDGAASKSAEDLQVEPESFSSTQHAEARYKNFVGVGDATVVTGVSQADADKRATEVAQAIAQHKLEDSYASR